MQPGLAPGPAVSGIRKKMGRALFFSILTKQLHYGQRHAHFSIKENLEWT